jgi:hypothetical protein
MSRLCGCRVTGGRNRKRFCEDGRDVAVGSVRQRKIDTEKCGSCGDECPVAKVIESRIGLALAPEPLCDCDIRSDAGRLAKR